MTDIQVLVDKSPLPPGFSPVCDPLDSSEARVRDWGRGGGPRSGPCGQDQGGAEGRQALVFRASTAHSVHWVMTEPAEASSSAPGRGHMPRPA